MNDEGRFFRWASRILAVVCLVLLGLNLLQHFRRAESAAVPPEVADAAAPPPAVIPVANEQPPVSAPHRVQAKPVAPARHRSVLVPLQPASRAVEEPTRPDLEAKAGQIPVPAAEPKVTKLQPMGYVERGDGMVEAVVADGPYVAVLREGEIFRNEYRVARVTPSAVELEGLTTQAPPQSAVAELVSPAAPEKEVAVAQEPAGKSARTAKPQLGARAGDKVGDAGSRVEVALALKPQGNQRQRAVQPELPPVVAESEDPNLSPQPRSPAENGGSPAQPPAGPVRTLKPLGFAEWASGRFQAVVEDEGEIHLVSEGEFFGDNYLALRVTESAVEVVEGLSPPTRASPMELAAAGAWEPSAPLLPERDFGQKPHKPGKGLRRTSQNALGLDRGAPIEGRSVPESAPPQRLPTLGYVETRNEGVAAIVADGDGVRVVHRGDVVGGTYQAVSVSRSFVELASASHSTPPSFAKAEPGGRGLFAPGSEPRTFQPAPLSRNSGSAGLPEGRLEGAWPTARAAAPGRPDDPSAASEAPLGYVKLADGRVRWVLTAPGGVRLAPGDSEPQGDRQALVAADRPPPGAGSEGGIGQEDGPEAREILAGPVYLVTHVHSPRFDFDLHVRLPDNRSE